MSTPQHPSFLTLDRFALGSAPRDSSQAVRGSANSATGSSIELLGTATPGDPESELFAHLEGCERCRAYLSRVARAGSVPPWVSEISGVPRVAPRRRSRALPAAALSLALAAAAMFVLFRSSGDVEPYSGSKGAPSVWVHVQHDGVRTPWDGSPLSAGDRIRLELAPDDFEFVTVFSLAEDGAPARLLHRGRVRPHLRVALDKAWQVDGLTRVEQLSILFSRRELSEPAARASLQQRDPAETHLVRLVLPLRAAP